ncbi:MAG: thioesterase [Pirellulales bacterium]|nr:thioesterase [Pirellulales bacterium]
MNQSRAQYLRLADNRLGLRALGEAAAARRKLVCFPHAGGQSLAFRELTDALPDEWSVWGVDLPAHGWAAGPPLTDIPAIAEFCLAHLPGEILDGAILFGHSLGGCVAFEMASRLVERGLAPPALVLSATRPPHRLNDYESLARMEDAHLLETLIFIGGLPSDWATEPEMFDHFKGAIRSDLIAFENFRIERPLSGVPTLILAGLEDVVCRPEHSFEWSRYCADCQVELVREGHGFLQSQPGWIAERLFAFLGPARS